jgi:hypothetical protein
MMKIILTLALAFFVISLAHAQKIKITDDIVYVDGTECLKLSGDASSISFHNLEGDEIIFLKYAKKYGKLYNKVVFIDQEVSFTSQSYAFTRKNLIKKMIEDGTLTNCQLNPEKAKKFAMKYDENVEWDF